MEGQSQTRASPRIFSIARRSDSKSKSTSMKTNPRKIHVALLELFLLTLLIPATSHGEYLGPVPYLATDAGFSEGAQLMAPNGNTFFTPNIGGVYDFVTRSYHAPRNSRGEFI